MPSWNNAAVLIINVQVDFLSSTGFASKLGRDISSMRAMLPDLKQFLKEARIQGLPLIFCQYVARKDLSPRNIRINKDREEKARICLLDSRGSDLYSILPKSGERVVKHRFYDAFAESELKEILTKLKIKTVLISGVRTELSVDATAKRAISEGFEVVILENLVSTYSGRQSIEKQLLEVFDRYYGYVLSSSEFLEQLD